MGFISGGRGWGAFYPTLMNWLSVRLLWGFPLNLYFHPLGILALDIPPPPPPNYPDINTALYLFLQPDMQRAVEFRFRDTSTLVREAAVDLVGRFVLSRPELTSQYYDMICERIRVSTSVSLKLITCSCMFK